MTQPHETHIDQPERPTPSAREPQAIPPADSAAELASILDVYMADLQAGQSPDRAELLAAHPALAAQLEACLAGIEFVHRAAGPAAGPPASLGEFRILRELGRGGMGVVYEAEQTSLRRRVALKVLRFGAVADHEAMQRFRREAETVGKLHHTNIVPIFAVGCERDVHYFAMQFIEGQSLADIQASSRQSARPLSPQAVAGWGLQAAEALAHAHQRGVIHRDIKPSNLLLDSEGVLWLTDFGLAKRADEATLTVKGALMGTPQYMSPEQAESLERALDHRTDLYSLGATLYELATGRPVFESATPQGIIARILNEQPARPRTVRPNLPRDLETIILTCLAKDPSHRYQTAHALAQDLRAVADGRPIQARRTPVLERLTRYVRKQKKAILRGAMVVAVTSLLIAGSFLGWRSYSISRLGRLLLATDGPPLSAEVLSESGEERIGEPFAVGTHTVVSVPEGGYRLRVEGRGVLSQTYQFALGRGELGSYRIAADESRLLWPEPISFAFASDAMVLSPGKADLVEWTCLTLIRRDGASGKPVWDASRPAKPWGEKRDPVAWIERLSYLGDEKRPGGLVRPAPDLDGDGTADIVWVFRGTPALLALSGTNGSMLWNFMAQADGAGGPDLHGPAWPQSIEQVPRPGGALGRASARDIDGDGIADLIAAFLLLDDPPPRVVPRGRKAHPAPVELEGMKHKGRRVVVAVSGRSGKALWSYPIDRQTTTMALDPLDAGAVLIDGRKGSTVGFVDRAGDLDWFEPRGRKAPGPADRPGILARSPGAACGPGRRRRTRNPGARAGARTNQQTLAAFSCGSGRQLWTQTIRAQFKSNEINPPPNWPVILDLDGDGRSEIVVADSVPAAGGDGYRGVRMLDGASGADRWARPIQPERRVVALLTGFSDGLAHVIGTPDLDGDGWHDLVTVSRFDGRIKFELLNIYVDAISGKDGHSLWWWHSDFKVGYYWHPSVLIWPPFLWGRGESGWPMVAVPLGGTEATWNGQAFPEPHHQPPRVHLLSLATGAELHAIDGLSWPRPADLDGDGLEDLWGSLDGKLWALRGEAPEAWRALGRYHKGGDLDGDGIVDLLSDDLRIQPSLDEQSRKTLIAVARSGRDGRLLWRSPLDFQGPWFEHDVKGEPGCTLSAFALPGGDLDGDGFPEVSVTLSRASYISSARPATLPLEVLSGRSGRRLWSTGPLPLGFAATGVSAEIASIDLRACEPRGPMDLIVRHQSMFVQQPGAPLYAQDRLARVSGRSGRVIWDVPLEARMFSTVAELASLPREFGDLDGDGGLDVVVIVPVAGAAGPSRERRAVSLRDGKTLWSHASPPDRAKPGPAPPAGATGQPRSASTGSTAVLDPGDSTRLPRLLFESGDATVCRLALPTTPEGAFQPARRTPIAPRSASHDPRWMRPLPWNATNGPMWPGLLFQLGGLALINIGLPLAILRMATRRRIRSVRLLLAIPVAVAIPLAVSRAFLSLSAVQLTASTVAGIPFLVYAGALGQSIINRRIRRFAVLIGLTVLYAVVIGSWWFWYDSRGKSAFEYYSWSGWYLVAIPGAFIVGALACIAWPGRGAFRVIVRLRQKRRQLRVDRTAR